MSDALDDRLAGLARSWALPPGAAPRLRRLLELVAAEPRAITSIRDPLVGVERHVADSLAGLRVPALRSAASLADLGSGGGFPGLVLAVALPDAAVRLVESVGGKCAFLRGAAAALALDNVEVVHARAEGWAAGRDAHDVVTARALAPLDVLAEYAAPLLRDGATLVAWKGARDPREEAAGRRAATILGLAVRPPLELEPRPGEDHRHLQLYVKERPTPSRFPRRAGMARKRPLGGST